MNIMFIIEIITCLFIFLIIKILAYNITFKWGLPQYLNYKPYCCFKCLQFWWLLFTYPILYISSYTQYHTFLILGISLTILDAIAMHIDENNTTSIND